MLRILLCFPQVNDSSYPNNPPIPQDSSKLVSTDSVPVRSRRKSSLFCQNIRTNSINSNRKKTNAIKKERQKKEDHLSTIFMGYVMVFLICHTPRLVLNFYELTGIRRALECARLVHGGNNKDIFLIIFG